MKRVNRYFAKLTKLIQTNGKEYQFKDLRGEFGISAVEMAKDVKLVKHNLAAEE